jgi:sigma-B regulation protein RsbU (phosphoserine phosphatase)
MTDSDDTQDSAVRTFDQLELLSEMGRDFASSLDIQGALERAVSHITDYVEAEGGALFLIDETGDTLKCHACVGATDIIGLTLPSDQGIVGRCVQNDKSEIVRDVQNDPNFYGKIDETTGYTTRSILCATLSVKDQRIGAIELINKRGGDHLFEENDLRILESMAAPAALAIHNARMSEALVEQERFARELELAAEIQRSLLPEDGGDEFPVHGINIPARTVSGDFYDFFELDDGRICFNLGDVSGKGMNAALLMAKTSSLFRCLGKTIHQPGRLLSRINLEICETAARGMFVTMVVGIYDPRSGIMRFSNAGHEPPLFFDSKGEISSFPADAPPVGISPYLVGEEGYPEEELRLDGGAFYIFTDGVTEGYLVDGSEMGVDGLTDILHASRMLTAEKRLTDVVDKIDLGSGPLRDDITILSIDDTTDLMAISDAKKRQAARVRDEDDAGEMEELFQLDIPSRADRLRLVRSAVAQAGELCDYDDELVQNVVIAVDEALQNVIRHAYENRPDGEIKITLSRTANKFVVHIRDYADSIDVDKVKPRDLGDIRPGGLGTHFIQEVMDEVEFLPTPDERGNLLKMVKQVT